MDLMKLTSAECQYLLECIRQKEGPGYSDDPLVGPLQAKLSMLGELAVKMGR